MNGLEPFTPDTKGEPPRQVSAGKLDRNFARCMPLPYDGPTPPYRVNFSKSGWRLVDLTGLPADAKSREVTLCENGVPVNKWILFWDENPLPT